MWPKAFWEKLYEPVIRKAAGLGSLSGAADPDAYDHGFLHCDILIVGGGPSGLAAALAAAGSSVAGRQLLSEMDLSGTLGDVTISAVGCAADTTLAGITEAEDEGGDMYHPYPNDKFLHIYP